MADTKGVTGLLSLAMSEDGKKINEQYSALDADTLVDTSDPSKTYRQPNFNAPEVGKVLRDKEGNFTIKEGSPVGGVATEAFTTTAKSLGYDKVKVLNEGDEAYGRGSAVLVNPEGQTFNNFLLSNRIVRPTMGASKEAVLAYELGGLRKTSGEAFTEPRNKKAVEILKGIVDAQFGDDPRAKRIAFDELEYATGGSSEMFQSVTATDDYDKNLDNTAVNPILTASSVGWESLVGSLYGSAFLLGDKTGIDSLREFGSDGAYQSAQAMQNFGKFKSEFEDVEDFDDALEFLGTNLAISVPYMGATALGVALAPVTSGASLALPVSMYTGQVWNEQPIDNKNATSAITAGVLMSALDVLGVKGVGKVATKGTSKEVFNSALTKLQQARPNLTPQQAKNVLLKQSRFNIAKLAGEAGDIAKEQLKKRNLFKDSMSRILQTGAIEGGTEAIQEMIGYIGANYDNPAFDFEEMQDRMVKAGITGGALGGSFGAVGSVANVAGWVDASFRAGDARSKNLSDAGKRAVELEAEGADLSLEALTEDTKERADDFNLTFANELLITKLGVEGSEAPVELSLSTVSRLNESIEQFKVPGNTYEYDVEGVPDEGVTIEVPTDPVGHYYAFNKLVENNQDVFGSSPELRDIESMDELLVLESESPEVRKIQREANDVLNSFDYTPINVPKEKVVDYINKNSIDPMAVEHKKVLEDTPKGKAILQALRAFPAYFFKGAVAFAIPPALRDRSKSAVKLFDMFGGGNQSTYSGQNFEEYKSDLVALFRNMVEDADSFYESIAKRRLDNPKLKSELGSQIHNILSKATKPNETNPNTGFVTKGSFDPDMLTQETYTLNLDGGTIVVTKSQLAKLGNDLQSLSDKMYEMQVKYNKDIGYIPNYLSRFKTLNKIAIEENRRGFVDALKEHADISEDVAQQLTDNILNNQQANTLDGMFPNDVNDFSVTKGGVVPGSHKKRSLNMAESDLFNEFMEQDIFRNVAESAKQASRYVAYQKYVGKNGSIVGQLLKDMKSEGIPEEEVNRTAKYMKDYLDAESGNYNRPEDAFGQTLANIQKNLILVSTIVFLPMATISSIVELALMFKGLTREQIFNEKTGIKGIATQMGKSIFQGMQEGKSMVTKGVSQAEGTVQQKRMKQLGYYSWDVGAATVTGVTEVSATKQRVLELFFKVNLLQGFTQMTRAIRLSFAYDYMSDHIANVVSYDGTTTKTNDIQQSEEILRNLGINVAEIKQIFKDMDNDMIRGAIDPEQSKSRDDRLETILRMAESRFINEASMLPTGNKVPFFYQDPRFALFNQFQGFIAMFTSTFIPKLWGEYVKRGSPAMKYNAFATMAGMILLGFLSQYIKDQLKYGEDSPYLDDLEYMRRGLSSSGLLGTTERFLDTMFPIYETRSDNAVEWMYNEIVGQSPSLGFADTGYQAIGDAVSGEGEKAFNKALKMTPIGLFTDARKDVASVLSGNKDVDWNPFGD